MAGQEFYIWRMRHDVTVRLSLPAVDRINAALTGPQLPGNHEQGGILLGHFVSSGVTEITGFELFPSEHRRGVPYDLGQRERSRLTSWVQRLRRRKGDMPVGYFRTHRRPGLFLDQGDFYIMKDAFADPSCKALLIKPAESGPATAGFFFWENEDIDRTRTQLAFPFDARLLRQQEPVVSVAVPDPSKKLLIPAWQAMAMAVVAALLGFGIVSFFTSHTQSNPQKVLVAMSVEPESTPQAGVVPPQPHPLIMSRIPDSLAARLSRELPVDVRVSIDRRGVVRDAEVVDGGTSEFDTLAANNASRTPWRPAHQGQQTVPSEMIVHYYFTPAIAERR